MTEKELKDYGSLKLKVANGNATRGDESELNRLGNLKLRMMRSKKKEILEKTYWDVEKLKKMVRD